MLTIAVANQKGGAGKTTTTYHLGEALSRYLPGLIKAVNGEQPGPDEILMVDNDPQGNLTRVTAADQTSEDQAGLADVLSSRTDMTLSDVVVPARWPGVDLAPTPSTETLAGVRDELVIAGPGRERRLKEALDTVADRYAVCLIDCPPSLDQLTINAFAAADKVLIVTQAKLFASDGLGNLLRTIDTVRDYYNPNLTIGGALINHLEEKTVTGRHWRDALIESAAERGFEILNPAVAKRIQINDAMESGTSLAHNWGPDGRELAEIYLNHAKTLVKGAI